MDLEEFKYGGTNITAFRLMDPEGAQVRKIVRDWNFALNDPRNKKVDYTNLVSYMTKRFLLWVLPNRLC